MLVGGVAVSWPLKVLRGARSLDVPDWITQLILWRAMAAANFGFARCLVSLDDGKLVQIDPADPTRFVWVKPQHIAFWIPVRYWTWLFVLAGVYGSAYVWIKGMP